MATSPLNCQTDLFVDPSQPYDTCSDIQSEGAYRTAAPGTPRESRISGAMRSRIAASDRATSRPPADGLDFLSLDEWDEHNSYDEDIPTRLRYTVEWKVMVNNKVIAKETEQDVVLAPAAYWHMCLHTKVQRLVSRKLPPGRNVEYDDTNVVVSVNDRSERDVTKQFDTMDIDWSATARQLVRWGELFRVGKKLRVDLSFNYVEPTTSAAQAGRVGQRGSSATQRMLADRALQLDAEQDSGGRSSIWREVYALMRCPGPPCNLGPHCWRDPFGKKHYKLRTHHLKALIELVQQGLVLNTHNDVPEEIRDQLYAEDHQRRESTTNHYQQCYALSLAVPGLSST